jgi:hypothetical protein
MVSFMNEKEVRRKTNKVNIEEKVDMKPNKNSEILEY